MRGRAVGLGVLAGVVLGWGLGEGLGPASAAPTGQSTMHTTTEMHPRTHRRPVMDLTIPDPANNESIYGQQEQPCQHAKETYATVIVR
jgi:hypothetical protein